MQTQLLQQPDYGMACVTFDQAGEQLVVESGAMVARDPKIKMKTKMRGGLLKAAKRKLFGGESLFLNTFTATEPGQRLFVAPAPEGDLQLVPMQPGQDLIIQSGSFLAAEPTVQLDTKWSGFKGFLSGEGFFFLKASGQGNLFINTYGGLHQVQLTGQPYIVDTSHIVAFSSTVTFTIRKVGGLKSLFLSGEGLVCEFTGVGTLWLQTRNPTSLASFLNPFRAVKRQTGST
ncbi:MAG: TIGR00266 family protein [Bradymonadales bacterium]|nr:TIGR00266 family protein [Bradymonadales bacterium]